MHYIPLLYFSMDKHYVLTSVDYISGKVVLPHYRNVFLGVSRSSISTAAYGILIGQRWDILVAVSLCLIYLITLSFSVYFVFSILTLLIGQNTIYMRNSSSFSNAMDVPALQRILVSMSWFAYRMLQMRLPVAPFFVSFQFYNLSNLLLSHVGGFFSFRRVILRIPHNSSLQFIPNSVF